MPRLPPVPEHADSEPTPTPPQHAEGPLVVPSDPSHRADGTTRQPRDTRPRHRRRVTTDAPEGSDPAPAPEPARHASTENDERLKGDKPPHWG